jgi:ABC-type polysaccharide/polyol phosphate export permease
MNPLAAERGRTTQRRTRSSRVDYGHELRELMRRYDLLKYLTVSMLKSGHRELVLGQLWWLLEPIITMAIYVFLIQGIFRGGNPNFAAFIFVSILPFRWFTQAVSQSQGVLTSIGGLMREVAFPKAIYPIALMLSNFFNFLVGFFVLVALLAWHHIFPTWNWLWLIPLVLQFAMLTLGISLLVSAGTFFFQDLKNIMNFVLQVLFYVSPCLYEVDRVPERFQAAYMMNPFASVFPAWRQVLLHGAMPNLRDFATVSAESAVILVLGYVVFVRLEKVFPKLV